MAALASIKDDEAQASTDNLQKQWLEEHASKITELGQTLAEMMSRLESFGPDIKERLESNEYLNIVRKGFRQWDQADTQDKKRLVANLITTAGASRICSDDVIRLFLDWIELYHEIHFSVIGQVYNRTGSTRASIWRNIHGRFPREDSADADLYKMVIRDLSIGGVIRQHREKNYDGSFIARKPERGSKASGTMKSAFDDDENYELTELGKQFVHYTMQELVPRVEG